MAETQSDRLTLWHHPATRLTSGAAVGLATTLTLGLWRGWDWLQSALVGWNVLALIFTASTWLTLSHFDFSRTKSHAGDEGPNGLVPVLALVVGGSIASVAGISILLDRSHSSGPGDHYDLGAGWLAVGTIVLSWLTIHTLFALIYAKTYFAVNPRGGIDFNSPSKHDQPRYLDFFYVAFAVGVSFAMSDTNLTSTRMRTIALGHSLLSFAFGAIIVASVVNLMPSLG